MNDSDNMLALLESLMPPTTDETAMKLARDFRQRRIEKNITRREIADKAGIPVSNVARFEQKGMISLRNLIDLATALGYHTEIQDVFSKTKYSTMKELTKIQSNRNKKKAPGHRYEKD